LWWRTYEPQSERLQVLNDRGEVELVAGTGQTSEPHAIEAVMGLQVREAHLDALALIA